MSVRWSRVLLVMSIVLAGLFVLFAPILSGLLLVGELLVSVLTLMRVMRGGIVSFSRIWPSLLLILLLAAAASGLQGDLPGITPGDYVFQPSAGMSNGRYQGVAQADGFAYLESCRPTQRHVVAVQQTAIVTIRPERESRSVLAGPNLWHVLFNGDRPTFGLKRC